MGHIQHNFMMFLCPFLSFKASVHIEFNHMELSILNVCELFESFF